MRVLLSLALACFALVAGGQAVMPDGSSGDIVALPSSTAVLSTAGRPVVSAAASLSESLTVNGTTVAPFLSYRGENATASTWGDLAIASTGADPVLQVATPSIISSARGVTFGAGKSYRNTTAGTGALSTDDVAIEAWFKAGTTGHLASTRVTQGWCLQQQTSTTARFLFTDSGGGTTIANFTVVAGSWNYVIIFLDKSDGVTGVRLYLNGALVATTTAMAPSVDAPTGFAIGSGADTNAKTDSTVSFVRAWKLAGWFAGGATNTSQWLAVAQARNAQIVGPRGPRRRRRNRAGAAARGWLGGFQRACGGRVAP